MVCIMEGGSGSSGGSCSGAGLRSPGSPPSSSPSPSPSPTPTPTPTPTLTPTPTTAAITAANVRYISKAPLLPLGTTTSASTSISTSISTSTPPLPHTQNHYQHHHHLHQQQQQQQLQSLSSSAIPSTTTTLFKRNSASPSVPRKIMSKNHNNTLFPTSFPNNLAELQLYRVMQNASLLYYYDTLLEMGGDDVQQLCDAGEEEFLEIMSLVGMASKPLHVRRLQKSLQEWVSNPSKFKVPPVPGDDFEIELSSPRISSNHHLYPIESNEITRPAYSPSSTEVCALPPVTSPGLCLTKRPYSPLDGPSCPPSSSLSPGGNNMLLQLTPTLLESQISKIAISAERLSKQLPQFEPKSCNTKKKMSKELELVISMSENDPRRMDEIRRYAAIYGRFDCKRRPEKPLTLHEVSVNEAAAQICRFIPALLTRRDELFPLARQVVKDSGCHYSKTQVSSSYGQRFSVYERDVFLDSSSSTNSRASPQIGSGSDQEGPLSKRAKLEVDDDDSRMSGQLYNIKSLHTVRDVVHERRNSVVDYDEIDSHLSFSNSSSPCQVSGSEAENSYAGENIGQQRTIKDFSDTGTDDMSKYSPKIIAASGDNIIAVANPALAMSTALLPLTDAIRESRTTDNHN